jgi:hypothetical protein
MAHPWNNGPYTMIHNVQRTINAELAEHAETLDAAPQGGVAGTSDRERTKAASQNRSFAIRRAAPVGLQGRPTASSVWQ